MKRRLFVCMTGFLFAGLCIQYILKQKKHNECKTESAQRSLQEDVVTFLQEYIAIDTSHPNPNYNNAISFLKKNAQVDGFEYQELLLPSGRPLFVMCLRGTDPDLPALLLNHHMDVVPAGDTSAWKVSPFLGLIHEDAVVGRGAQDMKGIAAVHYTALKALKKNKKSLSRTIYITAVPDEEIGGFKGTGEFINSDFFKTANIGFVIDEGHASGNDQFLDIKVAERKPIQICVRAEGELAHGSHLLCDNANHRLIELLVKLVAVHHDQRQKVGSMQPGELLSLNITALQSGVLQQDGKPAYNTVPSSAIAIIDIRVPPTMKKRDVILMLDECMKKEKGISYTILAQAEEEPEVITYQTCQMYKAFERVCSAYDLQVQAHFFEASSDLRFYQALGIVGLGITPFTIKDNIHGINESVPIDQLLRAREIFTDFLIDFCA